MNAKGGGLNYISEVKSDELRVFRGGLRHIPALSEYMQTGSKITLHSFHDKISYDRVNLKSHSRASFNTPDLILISS